MQDAQEQKTVLETTLKQIKSKLEKLREDIQVFGGYDQLEKEKKACEKMIYWQKLKGIERQLGELVRVKRLFTQEKEELSHKREEFLRNAQLEDEETRVGE